MDTLIINLLCFFFYPGNAITFYREFPQRSIQVISRLYKSPSEILSGFDLDCSCVGFNGSEVFVAPRAIRAFNTRCNMIDMTRRSLSYEARLFKYAKRGFATVLRGMSRNEINPLIYEHFNWGDAQGVIGLKRLLMLEQSFRDFREPECTCVGFLLSAREQIDDDKSMRNELCHFEWGNRDRCLAKKIEESTTKEPVTMRTVYIHERSGAGFWNLTSPGNRKLLNTIAGPGPTEDSKMLSSKMKGNQNTTSQSQDYEYVCLPVRFIVAVVVAVVGVFFFKLENLLFFLHAVEN